MPVRSGTDQFAAFPGRDLQTRMNCLPTPTVYDKPAHLINPMPELLEKMDNQTGVVQDVVAPAVIVFLHFGARDKPRTRGRRLDQCKPPSCVNFIPQISAMPHRPAPDTLPAR